MYNNVLASARLHLLILVGLRTFKVSAPGAEPPVVALHSRCVRLEGEGEEEEDGNDNKDDGAVDEVGERRMEAAAAVFSQHGVGPKRLAQGGDWFIDAWVGSKPWHAERAETEEDLRMAAQGETMINLVFLLFLVKGEKPILH